MNTPRTLMLYCTWEKIPSEETHPKNTCICLSGQKWVSSPINREEIYEIFPTSF